MANCSIRGYLPYFFIIAENIKFRVVRLISVIIERTNLDINKINNEIISVIHGITL